VTARESIHNELETVVNQGTLVVRYRNGKTYDADETIRIEVQSPNVHRFQLNTSGSIYVNNDLQQPTLFFRSAGSGSIHLKKIFANSMEAESVVSGSISSTGGTTQTERLRTDASGRIDMSAVTASSVYADIIGSGDISLRASDFLDVTIKGSGDVYFAGYPQISTHISGTGHLVRF
jgi:hypothetical protein